MCRHPNVDLMNISGKDVQGRGMDFADDAAVDDEVVVYFAQKPGTSVSFETLRNELSHPVNGYTSFTKSNGLAAVSRTPQTASDSVPDYLQPDRYEGLIEKVRKTIQESDSDVVAAKRVMAELQRKAERLLPGAMIQPADLNLHGTSVNDSEDASDSASVVFTVDDKQTHYLARKSLKDATCEICGLGFASVQSKMRHAKRIHPNDLDRISANTYEKTSLSHECSQCGKSFATGEQLSTHCRRRHDSERAFMCSVCDRSYPLPSELNKHMKRVHGGSDDVVAEKRNLRNGADMNNISGSGSGRVSGSESLVSRPCSRSTYDGSEDMPDL